MEDDFRGGFMLALPLTSEERNIYKQVREIDGQVVGTSASGRSKN